MELIERAIALDPEVRARARLEGLHRRPAATYRLVRGHERRLRIVEEEKTAARIDDNDSDVQRILAALRCCATTTTRRRSTRTGRSA